MEIELKAHVADNELIKLLLFKKAEYRYAFEKEDTYWFLDNVLECDPRRLRIRSEKRSLPDGREESFTYLTHKIKEVRNGLEVNNEREFEISSSSKKTAEEFSEVLRIIGFEPGVSKVKCGFTFSYDGINAELCEVGKLGWFLELEIIADNKREETVSEGRKRLLNFLADMCIDNEAIESRFYSEMLRNA